MTEWVSALCRLLYKSTDPTVGHRGYETSCQSRFDEFRGLIIYEEQAISYNFKVFLPTNYFLIIRVTRREEGGGFRMGNTCIPMADPC